MRSGMDLNDLITHRRAWQTAIIQCKNAAQNEGRSDDLSYWQHELDVFNRTFSVFRKAE